jgi:hypothetical protein
VDELIKLVAGKVGISPEQAEQAVTTVLGFLKDKLPGPIAGQLDKVVGGDGGGEAGGGGMDLGDIGGALGGLLGKK